jgi:hypothetical protein
MKKQWSNNCQFLSKNNMLLRLFLLFAVFACSERRTAEKIVIIQEKPAQALAPPALDTAATHIKAQQALAFCKQKGMNTDFCILIDMSRHSGLKRFLVWDFHKDSIDYGCLVSHGCCDKPWGDDYSKDSVVLSNRNGSHCSAEGKYRIGERGESDWGIHVKYLLYGLESSNSNALKRTIVLHSWDWVEDAETYPRGTPEGWGCPAISNTSLQWLDPRLKAAKQPVLMWVYR